MIVNDRISDHHILNVVILPRPAGNESCPQPQTSEHLAAIEIMKLKHILIVQNKIDLVKESQAREQYDQILKFVQGTARYSTQFFTRYRNNNLLFSRFPDKMDSFQ